MANAGGGGPKILIAGASGFAGAIAARLVQEHPVFSLGPITARAEAGQRLVELYPQHRVEAVLEELDLDAHAERADAAIVGYPHAAAAPVVKALLDRGLKVIDLFADFRLRDLATYEDWYGEHPHPELIGQSVYGLPELYRDQLAGAQLVSGPGCFPTAALLGLRPLAAGGLLADVIIDAKTGGVRRGPRSQPRDELRHDQRLDLRVQDDRPPAPPRDRAGARRRRVGREGHVRAAPRARRPGRVRHRLRDAHAAAVAGRGERALRRRVRRRAVRRDRSRPPNTRGVRETNHCRIHVQVEEHTAASWLFSAIDNL